MGMGVVGPDAQATDMNTTDTPIPGSPQYDMYPDYGELDTTDWSKFNGWRPVFVPHGLTQKQLLDKQR